MKLQANSVKDLIDVIHNDSGISCKSQLKNAITFVNDVNFLKLKKYKTPLKTGDKVAFLSPASGG
ncbi:MoaD/ThiS family protein [Acidaminobacter sp. JC074]|uniref:MoaD/ThiS family protein n=1 Tax=Acidaminobacter sp. JC074 TaxID=2530199 RepID=UPI001F0E2633|nr:MoaD/ThiS family protein [Acidaminobacter sp. JC074]